MNKKLNKYFYQFLKINKKIVKDYKNSKGNMFIIDRGRFNQTINSSIVAASINQKYKLNIVIISDLLKDSNIFKVYKSFGCNNFITGFKYNIIFKNIWMLFWAIFLTIKSIFLINTKSWLYFIQKFNIENVKIGDLIYDSYTRYEQRFLKPKTDLYCINVIFTSIYRCLNLLSYFRQYSPKFVIIGTQSFASNSGICLKICCLKKIKVLEPYFANLDQEYRLRIYDQKKIEYGYQNTYDPDFKKFLIKDKKNEKRIDNFLKKRLKAKVITGLTGVQDLLFAYSSKIILTKEKLLEALNINKKIIKKIVLFAPHAFTDAPHGRGSFFIFRDYFAQFTETLEFIDNKEYKDILWIVKPHPTSIFFYGENGIVKDFIKKTNNPMIQLCPENLNTGNLIDICDLVVTGRGTIGLEAATRGKTSIIAGGAAYSGLNVAIEHINKKSYFKTLSNLEKISKLKKTKIMLAKKALYFFDIKKIELRESKILDDNVRSTSFNFNTMKKSTKKQREDIDIFNKRLIKNLNKLSFEKDVLFKDLIKTI